MKKVLIATPLYPPEIGGPATYTALLEGELPKRGFQVEILPFREVRPLPKIVRHGAYFLRSLAKGRDCDIIFAQDPVSVGLPSLLAAKIMRKRFVLKVVGDYAWEMYNQQPITNNQQLKTLEEFQVERFDWLTEIRRKVERFVARKAEKVIVPSYYLAGIVRQWGIKSEQIKVIYNSFEPLIVREARERLRQKFGISGVAIITAGRLVPWKGFASLIELMPELLVAAPDAKLFIVGDGPELQNLRQMTDNLQLGDKVKFLGQLAQSDLHKYIAAADVFVLNTGYEGFSHMLLEALSLGLPVVTTPAGGNSELVKNGENGLVVAFNDKRELLRAILRVVRDSAFLELLSERARASVQKFSLQDMINKVASELS